MPISGVGGHAKVNAAVVPVAEWEIENNVRLAETTVSTSTGVRRANILPDGTFTVSFPWELTQIPEAIGLRPGAVIANLKLLLGASGKCYSREAIVEKVKVVENVATDVLRCVVSGFAQDGWGDPVDA
jgi:hypothetical protein